MSDTVISVEDLWKEYRLGAINHGTLKADLASWWARKTGKDDPNQRIDAVPTNDTSESADRFWALREVNFEVKRGEVLGVIGGNGAGKSTLLKILSRVTTPTRGQFKIKGRVASLLEVGTGFHPELTGRENVFLNGAILGMRKEEVAKKFDDIVQFAGVDKFIDTPVKRYSSGMYVRLAFAVAAHLESDILIVDEVLAVGDSEFQKRCLGKMDEVTRTGRTVLFVSHNLIAVQRLCGRSLWMKSGRSVACGPSAEIVPTYLAQQSSQLALVQIAPGLLYVRGDQCDGAVAAIDEIQIQDSSGNAKSEVRTWDSVRFRVRFSSLERFAALSVELQISTVDGATIILTSTAPDRTYSFGVEAGSYEIHCEFAELPLAAGEYILGAAIAIPNVEYLWRQEDLCKFEVLPKDIYGSGFAPTSTRSYIGCHHDWNDLRQINSPSQNSSLAISGGSRV